MEIARVRIALAVLLLAAAVAAQEPLAGPLPPELAPEVLAQGRTGAGNLEAEQQTEALDLYDEVDAQLVLAEQWASQAKDTLRQRQAAPASLTELAAALDEPADETPPAVPPDATVDELDLRVRQAEANLVARQQELQQLDDQQRQRETHQPQLPTLITEAKSRRSQLEGELEGTPPEGEHPTITAARRATTLARMRALQNEIAAHDAQLSDPTLWGELLGKRRELAAREVVAAERAVRAWRDALNRRRTQEAEAAERAAAEEVARVLDSKLVQDIAAENATDATTRTELAARIQQITRENEDDAALLAKLQADFDSTKAKVDAVGLTRTIGSLLVDVRRQSLPDVRDYRRRLARGADEMSSMRLARIQTEEELESLVDLATEAERRVADADAPTLGADAPEEVEEAVREQLVRRREQLDKLQSDYVTLIEQLGTLDLTQTHLIVLTEEYQDYINERILWVRTAPPIWKDPGLWTNTTSAVIWLLDPLAWGGVATRFGIEMIAEPNIAPSVFLLLVLLLIRGRARRGLDDTAAIVSRIRTDSFIHTLRALALTVLVAIPLPLTMWVTGGLLAHCAADGGPARAVAQGLRDTSLVFFVLQFVHTVCRPQGLADAHFRWPERDLQLMRRHLRWAMPLILPLLVVLSAVMFDRQEEHVSALGRLTDIASEIATATFFFCVLRLKGGVLTSTMERHPTGWLSRFRIAWFPLVVGLPLMIAALAMLGYLYTAGQVDLRVEQSLLLVLGLSVANALALRWLFVARRNLVLQQYRRRREALLAAAEEERADESGESRPAAATISEEPEAEEIDLPAVSAQTQRLLVFTITISMLTGLFFIWAPALPALSALDDGEKYKLWDRSTETEEKITDPVTGVERRYLSKGLVPVTPVDVIRAIVYLIFTIVATRNLPGLIEIVVLQRLPMQRAGRYAITTITRYVFAVLGIGLVFNSLGIGWAKVQWLAAAVSVGLGFGLQEIFANFVSGLIILFERPIRVGDTVTVGDVTGTVARIQMRATTIVTWDRTELVVPNKEFVTSQLVNWTLSDSVLRVVLKVGIAYGSDVEKAERILKEIVRDEPDILDEPLPRIIFTAFGDSTLDFEVRCYVDDPDLYRRIAHKVNKEIDRRFRLEGVEIAFPQRDLHLRTADVPLTILRREGGDWVEADDARSS